MSPEVLGAVVGGAFGLASGGFGPAVMRRLPEPELDAPPPEGESDEGSRLTIKPIYEKVLYAELAARPGLALILAVAAGLTGAFLGARLGWGGDLLVVLAAVPTGTWLCYIDQRTTFLPTLIIYPTLLAVAIAAVGASVVTGDWSDLGRAGLGMLAYGGFFYVVWRIMPGYGFGDVRLAFVLGTVLGYLGWYELAIGFVGAQFLGAVLGGVLALLKVIDPRRNPFGPYMLGAATVAAAYGPALADTLGY